MKAYGEKKIFTVACGSECAIECEKESGLKSAADGRMLKKEIRRKNRTLRDKLTVIERQEKSLRITERVVSRAAFQKASRLLIYMHYGSEVQTDGIIREALEVGKRVYVPRVLGKEMEFYRIRALSECLPGYRGIPEPPEAAEAVSFGENEPCGDALMILPGLAFDRFGGRIGYGGGFYDRYLQKHPDMITMGIAYDLQYAERLPAEETDIPVRLLVTESRTVLTKACPENEWEIRKESRQEKL